MWLPSASLVTLHCTELRIGADFVRPATNVRDLGVYLDADVSVRSHVRRNVAGCFAVLRKLRTIRRSVPTSVYQILVVSLVLSRLDYGNATLSGIPANLCCHLQSVLNAAARSVAELRRSDHITETLTSLHWLRAPERIQFKLATLTYRSLHGLTPQYLMMTFTVLPTSPADNGCGLQANCSWKCREHALQPSVTELSVRGRISPVEQFAARCHRLSNCRNLPPTSETFSI